MLQERAHEDRDLVGGHHALGARVQRLELREPLLPEVAVAKELEVRVEEQRAQRRGGLNRRCGLGLLFWEAPNSYDALNSGFILIAVFGAKKKNVYQPDPSCLLPEFSEYPVSLTTAGEVTSYRRPKGPNRLGKRYPTPTASATPKVPLSPSCPSTQ